jgi:large subunit ribosomal protein L27
MSHVKAGGSVRQHKQGKRHGKRLGLKKFGGENIAVGQIVLRQRGAKYKTGEGVEMGCDHTIFAMKQGKVGFSKKHGKTVVHVA